jgi:hypothetical protein
VWTPELVWTNALGSELIGLYESLAGLGILAWWGTKLSSKQRRATERESRSHVAAELIAAAVLIAGGSVALVGAFEASLTFVGLGMLLYASVNIAKDMLETNRKFGLLLVGEAFATAIIVVALLILA